MHLSSMKVVNRFGKWSLNKGYITFTDLKSKMSKKNWVWDYYFNNNITTDEIDKLFKLKEKRESAILKHRLKRKMAVR